MSKLNKRDRIKISENFYLDEFMHPDLYKMFGAKSTRYLNKQLVEIVELLRRGFNRERQMHNPSLPEIGFYLNNWANGGNLKNCGVRYFFKPHKKGSHSRHYWSFCADIHLTAGVDEKELYDHILRNKDYYFRKGLTTLEDYDDTPGWVHISIEWNPWDDEIRIIKP